MNDYPIPYALTERAVSWRKPEEGCGKRGFRSRDAARASNAKSSHKMRLYQCWQCGGLWHGTKAEER